MLLKFTISDESYELLKKLSKIKFGEFKNPTIYTKQHLIDSGIDEKIYFENNFCLRGDVIELLELGLIMYLPHEAYPSIKLTRLGRICLMNK